MSGASSTGTMYDLLRKLNRQGGAIVSANGCTAEQLATARQFGHLWADGEGLAFVYLPAGSSDRKSNAVGFGSALSSARNHE